MPRDSAYSIPPEELLQAYTLGYFPMAQHRDDPTVVWVLPDERGVLLLENARAPKRLRRTLTRSSFEVRVNTAFSQVIAACAEARPERRDTWINDQIIEVYTDLYHQGFAHSIECYDKDLLVGGLYGVALGGVFCGESMFSRATDASKIAMLHLIAHLKLGGFSVLDTQFHSDHLAQFGVDVMTNLDYQHLLRRHISDRTTLSATRPQLDSTTVLQSITQTS